jgi:tRNA (cmo5U34)-methyltransferase
MDAERPDESNGWSEETSRDFINYGRYIVPERDIQMQIICSLLSDLEVPGFILDLCCGEGLLEEILLDKFPATSILGLDGSDEMLQKASQRLRRFGERFRAGKFELASTTWRRPTSPINAVVSSLAIHHLLGPQKQALFMDVNQMLKPDGRFIIADVFEPGPLGKELAAETLDEVVRKRSFELDGNSSAFDFFKREGWNIFRYLDPEDIDKPSPLFDQLKWLEQAGFVEIDVHWMLAGHAIFSARKAK